MGPGRGRIVSQLQLLLIGVLLLCKAGTIASDGNSETTQTTNGISNRNCLVLMFLHPEKSAGTTLRAILNRQAQRAELDFISFLGENLHGNGWLPYLRKLLYEPVDTSLRLAIEIHAGQTASAVFESNGIPIFRRIRQRYESAGCTFVAVTLLRRPVELYLSYFQHWAIGQVPVCAWSMPMDIQARNVLGVAHKGTGRQFGDEKHPSSSHLLPPAWSEELRQSVRQRAQAVLNEFDVVGITERFEDFALLVARRAGLDSIAFMPANVRFGGLAHNTSYADVRSQALKRVNQTIMPLSRWHMSQLRDPAKLNEYCRYFGCHESIAKPIMSQSVKPHEACSTMDPSTFVDRAELMSQIDQALYEWANERFEEQIQTHPIDEGERAALRQRNNELYEELRSLLHRPSTPKGCVVRGRDGQEKLYATHKCIGLDDQLEFLNGQSVFEGCWYDIPWVFAPYERMWKCTRYYEPPKTNGNNAVPCITTCWHPHPGANISSRHPVPNERRCFGGCTKADGNSYEEQHMTREDVHRCVVNEKLCPTTDSASEWHDDVTAI